MVPEIANLNAGPPDLSGYAQYPIFQYIAGLVLAVGAVLAYLVPRLKGQPAPEPPATTAIEKTEIYFDGPLAKALKSLDSIAASMALTADVTRGIPELLIRQQNEVGERLREDRSKIYERIEEESREGRNEDAKLDARLRAVEQDIARLEGRLPARR